MDTRRNLVPHRSAVAALAAALAVAACAAPDEAARTPTSDTPAGTATSTDAGPLAEFLGWDEVRTPDPDDAAKTERRLDEYQRRVVACMAAQGFAHETGTASVTRARPAEVADNPWSLPREEFVATYGYGITTIDLPVLDGDDLDPNEERVEAMSAAERTAYHRALFGDTVPLDDDGRVDTASSGDLMVFSDRGEASGDGDRGCAGEAAGELFGAGPDEEALAEFASLMQDMERLSTRIKDDTRLRASATAWAGCMAGAGHPGFDRPGDPEAEIVRRLTGLAPPGDGEGGAGGPAAPGAGHLFVAGGVAGVDPADLEALRTFELEVAAADAACTAETGYDRTLREVAAEVEQAFVDANRERLEAYRDTIAQGRG